MDTGNPYRVFTETGQSAAGAVADFIEQWLQRPELRELVEAHGGRWPGSGSLVARLEALHDFSERWDFRRGAERLEVSDADHLDSDQVLRCAAGLRMATSIEPSDRRYKHAVALGGTALANVHRLRYLHDLTSRGLRVDRIVALTALRDISEQERSLAERHSSLGQAVRDAQSEFDVFVAAASRLFSQEPQVERLENPNAHLASASARVGNVLILAAPSADSQRRANTADNYAVYSEHVQDGDSVLIVTSSIYVPYQLFVGLQALGWDRGLTVEAIGFPPEWMGGVLTGPTNVLQELRSAFFGALALARDLG